MGNIYAPNDDGERANLWEELVTVLRNSQVNWCIGGDFNIVRNMDSKLGLAGNSTAMDLFSNFITNGELLDLPTVGGLYTWSSNRDNPIFCKLDRFLVSADWACLFDNLVKMVLPRSLSDHNPMMLSAEEED
ncbi:hypothetical protein REPUB_Repub05bG0100600 [Reevesia pubescens]